MLVNNNRVVATGYNGPASGYPANPDVSEGCVSYCKRASGQIPLESLGYGYACPSIHAEANALLHASRSDVLRSTLYVTHSPCADCAKLISNSGVVRVVMLERPALHRPNPVPYLESCGLVVSFQEV